jgi:hypothetical protein
MAEIKLPNNFGLM